jgi:uncharacterized membrane protein YbaN (DUF454 family)
MKLPAKILLITCGTISVALGVLGLFLPLLPTTPFLLLAAACYARSSEKLYDWLLGNRWFGEYIRNYREGKGIPLKRTAFAIALLWLTIGYSAIVAVSLLWVRLVLLVIAVGVTVHLVSISTTVRSRRAFPTGGHHVPAKKTDRAVSKGSDDEAADGISTADDASSAGKHGKMEQ